MGESAGVLLLLEEHLTHRQGFPLFQEPEEGRTQIERNGKINGGVLLHDIDRERVLSDRAFLDGLGERCTASLKKKKLVGLLIASFRDTAPRQPSGSHVLESLRGTYA